MILIQCYTFQYHFNPHIVDSFNKMQSKSNDDRFEQKTGKLQN